jgi:FAD/FMN-containing dehydrogenase
MLPASGDVLTANNVENADLFWALRGGGGNFGFVTSFTFQAQPLEAVIAGTMMLRDDAFADVVKTWRGIMRSPPEEMNGTIMAMPDGSKVRSIELRKMQRRFVGATTK